MGDGPATGGLLGVLGAVGCGDLVLRGGPRLGVRRGGGNLQLAHLGR